MYSGTGEGDRLSSSTSVHACQRFSLEEIQSATKDFDDDLIIGQGGFGKVYKGQLSAEEPGHVVAIKRFNSMSNQGEPEFRAEIETLSKLRHCHLVSLFGYCEDNKEMILVYQYMTNGTLYHHLHEVENTLNWVQRMKIAIGAGRGLDYLHTGVGTEHGIIHRDVKSSNILLDENLAAKISDFGLSKIGPTNHSSHVDASGVKGTFGYLDPEYFYTKKISRKTDVYAFGVVLFELLTGRRAVDGRHGEEQYSLVRWAKKCVKEKKLYQMVDSNIKGTISPKCIRQFAQIADRCVHENPKERPTMLEVVASLQAILKLQLKYDNSAKSSHRKGFTWKIHKYRLAVTKQNSVPEEPYPIANVTPDPAPTPLTVPVENDTPDPAPAAVFVSDITAPFMPLKRLNFTSYTVNRGLKEFTYDELDHATRKFQDTCVGKGFHREVYKGWVNNITYSPCNHKSGLPVAVKRFHLNEQIDWEMLQECYHPNLVELIGYCMESVPLILVYEFMHNGNFDDLLGSGVIARLPLVKKVQIAFGIVRGLLFLQKMQRYFGTFPEYKPMLRRRDIMLNKDFIAKISDYGVSDYGFTYKPSQSDIDSTMDDFTDHIYRCRGEPLQMDLSGFTMILAEVVTGKRILNESELDIIDNLLVQHEKMPLRVLAKTCFDNCYDVEFESMMLEMLKEYAAYIPACQVDTLYTATLEDRGDDTFYTAILDEDENEIFSTSFERCL